MRKKHLPIDLPDVNVLVALFEPAHVHHVETHHFLYDDTSLLEGKRFKSAAG
jgi:hypothetical protein